MVDQVLEIESQDKLFLLDETLNLKTLYQRASSQQWDGDADIDWSLAPQIDESIKDSWLKIIKLFFALELMGLSTLNNMLGKTANKFKDINLRLYLSVQTIDEARHVYVLQKYLGKIDRVNSTTSLQKTVSRMGSIASKGVYTVENFLVSTLFSENFASMYLRMCIEKPIDPLAKEIFKRILQDEGRHVKFQNIILPEVIKKLSSVGKFFVKSIHMTLMNIVKLGIKDIKKHSEKIGINSEEFLDRLINQLDRQYRRIGITSWIDPQKIRKILAKSIF